MSGSRLARPQTCLKSVNLFQLATPTRYEAVIRTTDEEVRSTKEETVDKLPGDGSRPKRTPHAAPAVKMPPMLTAVPKLPPKELQGESEREANATDVALIIVSLEPRKLSHESIASR